MAKYVTLTIERLKEALASAFHYANRQMKIAESDQFQRMIQSLRSGQTQMVPIFKISTVQPPYDPGRTVIFDVWGRTWLARTDKFEWERFTNVYMERESQTLGAKLVIGGLPDYAKSYVIEYWCPVAVPVEIEADDRFLYQYGG